MMKRDAMPGMLATGFRGPWRFGRRWRGREPQLRIGQAILLGAGALVGARLASDLIILAVRASIGLWY
jgi:hypothetical protein